MADSPIPQDTFSRLLRQAGDNPAASRASSTVSLTDFYGNTEIWVVETFRADGADPVFMTRSAADGSMRLVLPPQITAVLARQRDQVIASARRRQARDTMELRRRRGDVLGNAEALRKARQARK